MEKKQEIDENEYKNWFWHPASRRWRWHQPLHRSGREQTKPELQKNEVTEQDTRVYTQEECIRDLRNAFCKGRYRTWVGTRRRKK